MREVPPVKNARGLSQKRSYELEKYRFESWAQRAYFITDVALNAMQLAQIYGFWLADRFSNVVYNF